MPSPLGPLNVGDRVVEKELGFGTVDLVEDGVCGIVFEPSGERRKVRFEEAEKRLRRPYERATADKILKTLSSETDVPDDRGWGDRYVELQRVVRKGTPLQQAALLHTLYRLPSPLQASQEKTLQQFEDVLLPELAHVLGQTVETLRTQLHRGQPAFGITAPARNETEVAPPSSVPTGWKLETSFRSFGTKLVVGDAIGSEHDAETSQTPEAARRVLVVEAAAGVWHALSRELEDGWEYRVVHELQLMGFGAAGTKAMSLGDIRLEGGTFLVADAEVRDDRGYQRAFARGDLRARAFSGSAGGAETREVLGYRWDDRVLMLAIRCG